MTQLSLAGEDEPWSTGSAPCVLLHQVDHLKRLPVGVVCRPGSLGEVLAMCDTGAEYSIVGGDLAAALGPELSPTGGPDLPYSTRFGTVICTEATLEVALVADRGDELIIEQMTLLVCPEWPGPFTLGIRGGLECIRFAIDPGATADDEPRIYFGLAG